MTISSSENRMAKFLAWFLIVVGIAGLLGLGLCAYSVTSFRTDRWLSDMMSLLLVFSPVILYIGIAIALARYVLKLPKPDSPEDKP